MGKVCKPHSGRVRVATCDDVERMHVIRLAVRENQLTSGSYTAEDYIKAIEATGRGWVVEVDDVIQGFCIACHENHSIWALFIVPEYEGRGFGTRLLQAAVTWLHELGIHRIWLTTELHTRAQGFYESLGWVHKGYSHDGEILFELSHNPS